MDKNCVNSCAREMGLGLDEVLESFVGLKCLMTAIANPNQNVLIVDPVGQMRTILARTEDLTACLAQLRETIGALERASAPDESEPPLPDLVSEISP